MDEKISIKFLYENGYSPSSILKQFKKLSVSRATVYRTVKRLRETGTIDCKKRKSYPRPVRTRGLINKVKCRLWRNPKQSINKMASDLGVSQPTLHRLVKEDLRLRAYKLRKLQGLTGPQKEKRLIRSKALLKRFAKSKLTNIVFSDEKFFSVQQYHNSQNVRIYSASVEDIPEDMRTVERFQADRKVMVWAGISKKGKFPLVFVEPGAKINAAYNKRHILENVVRSQSQLMLNENNWTFQQESAPAQRAKTIQNWYKKNLHNFISSQDWLPSSPGLSPRDHFV